MPSPDVSYEDIPEFLVSLLPELRDKHDREVAYWSGEPIPPYPYFAEVLTPEICQQLRKPSNEVFLRRAFAAFETLAASQDRRVTDLIMDTLDALASERTLEAILPFCGPHTLRLVDELRSAS